MYQGKLEPSPTGRSEFPASPSKDTVDSNYSPPAETYSAASEISVPPEESEASENSASAPRAATVPALPVSPPAEPTSGNVAVGVKPSVVVVGAGPAGLFAALELVAVGIKPIIVERGM